MQSKLTKGSLLQRCYRSQSKNHIPGFTSPIYLIQGKILFCSKTHSGLLVTAPPGAFTMMQLSCESSNKHSLLNVMNRFIAATNNMDETIMVPNMLRDVPLEDQGSAAPVVDHNNHTQEPAALHGKQRDMYEHYLLLKSIKNDMEWGLLKRDVNGGGSFLEMAVKQEEQQQQKVGGGGGEPIGEDTSDLESQFHYHLQGLFGVLSKLTVQADHLTNRYKREIGGGNFIR
ncbi:hypothetical protein AAFF_G00433480 [Aldrovandia affinis]|uniref:Mid1-interacting protein 1 n=1 Tax=Aldrovandia affinis TaxID=143900 RepID=A0AAD7SAY9_9TELE|nr:hypothetical protein AAFF_G00433480 [Aldrovandia affinis]